MRARNRLTAKSIRNLARPGTYADGGGLYVQIGPTGTKCWIFRYMLKLRPRAMGLGSLHSVSLAQAREKAAACRRRLAEGIDPIDARDAERAAEAAPVLTFADCKERFFAAPEAGRRNQNNGAQWRHTLETLENHDLLKHLLPAAKRHQRERVALILAAHIGFYQARLGKVPMEETLATLHPDHASDDQVEVLAQGMETLVAILMLATGVLDDNRGGVLA